MRIVEDHDLIAGHVALVRDFTGHGNWPEDLPTDEDRQAADDVDVFAAWAFVTGYAAGHGMTTEALIEVFGLTIKCNDCLDKGWDHYDDPPHVEACDCGKLGSDAEAVAAHKLACGCEKYGETIEQVRARILLEDAAESRTRHEIASDAICKHQVTWCRARLFHALAAAHEQGVLMEVFDELLPQHGMGRATVEVIVDKLKKWEAAK